MKRLSLILSELKSNCIKYEVIQPLGRGKYSEVYEGIDIETE